MARSTPTFRGEEINQGLIEAIYGNGGERELLAVIALLLKVVIEEDVCRTMVEPSREAIEAARVVLKQADTTKPYLADVLHAAYVVDFSCRRGDVIASRDCTCSGFWPHDPDCPEGPDHS